MNDNTTLLYVTFTILVVPSGGAMLLFVTRRHRIQHQPHWLLPLLAAPPQLMISSENGDF